MQKAHFPTIICILYVSSGFICAQNQARLVEKITKKGSEIIIPYEQYVLPNGLTVLIHEDHSDPIVHIDVTYHVGSKNEQVGRSGFAHFFEHMMFQGSDNVADDEHFKIVSEAGGSLNGNTTTDRTKYFETLPANQLEKALWLEADRMGFLLDAVTQQKFEIQRATVKNERGQNYDNRPYGLVSEKMAEALYPQTHPYSWSTIGYIEDLNRVDVNDLKKFFLRWYGPNNAVLTVAGDVTVSTVLALIEKYFGPIPKGPAVNAMDKTPVKLDRDRYLSYEDNIRFPLLLFQYPTVPAYTGDEPALDALAYLLSNGKNSIFYQNFQKPQKAVAATVNHYTQELAGNFAIRVLAFPEKSLAHMDSLIRASLAEFEKKSITDEDIKKFKLHFETSTLNSLQSVSGKANVLSLNYIFTGNPNYVTRELERYNTLTKEDVIRVYNQYIKNKPAVILSVFPKGKPEMKAKPDTYTFAGRNFNNITESDEYKNLSYTKAKDIFDRSKKPAAGANPIIEVPDYWTQNFSNGLKAIGIKSSELPTVTLQLNIEAGHRFEDKNKAGIAQITADLLNESTHLHTAEQISELLEKLGSSINVSAGNNEITITVFSLKRNLDATLKIVDELLFHPKFDEEEFNRSKKQKLELIANQTTQPVTIANNTYNKLLYGDQVMGIPTLGNTTSVNAITLNDVKSYYETNFSSALSQLVVIGDVSKEDLLPKLDFLAKWPSKKISRTPESPISAITNTKIYFVNKANAPQSEIRIGYMALPYDATGDYYKASIMNHILGGAFSSRINLNLRENKGWTYGARSGFNGSKYAGPFTASAGVKANATDSAIVEFMNELKNYAENGITESELSFTKNSIGQNDALKYETPAQKAGFIKRILDFNLDKTFVKTQNEILKNSSKSQIDALAKKYLPYNKLIITVVGDKNKVYDRITKLGYEVIELDTDGNVLTKTGTPPGATEKNEIPYKNK